MKIIDEKEMQKKKKKQRQKRTRWTKAILKKWDLNEKKKLGFLQLICKASLFFKSNLELALLII